MCVKATKKMPIRQNTKSFAKSNWALAQQNENTGQLQNASRKEGAVRITNDARGSSERHFQSKLTNRPTVRQMIHVCSHD